LSSRREIRRVEGIIIEQVERRWGASEWEAKTGGRGDTEGERASERTEKVLKEAIRWLGI